MGSAAMDRSALNAFGNSAATLGPEGEAGAWRALADLTYGFESVVGSAGADAPSRLPSALPCRRFSA